MNTKKIYILFETDSWLTKSDATVLTVCTSLEDATKCFDEVLKSLKLTKEEKENAQRQFYEMKQTQNLLYNYFVREYETNCIVF